MKSVTRSRANKDRIQPSCLNYFKISIDQQQYRLENLNIATSQQNLPKSLDLSENISTGSNFILLSENEELTLQNDPSDCNNFYEFNTQRIKTKQNKDLYTLNK